MKKKLALAKIGGILVIKVKLFCMQKRLPICYQTRVELRYVRKILPTFLKNGVHSLQNSTFGFSNSFHSSLKWQKSNSIFQTLDVVILEFNFRKIPSVCLTLNHSSHNIFKRFPSSLYQARGCIFPRSFFCEGIFRFPKNFHEQTKVQVGFESSQTMILLLVQQKKITILKLLDKIPIFKK